jgi:hypothetical protein
MKAYLCSVGQKTTNICKEQLERFGFEVVMLDKKQPWEEKYREFINTANEDCLRIDADIIPNESIKAVYSSYPDAIMTQFKGYDFYKNDVGIIGVVCYNKEAIKIIKNNLDKIDWRRPEATAWRLREINNHTHTSDMIVGTHGYFQTEEDLERHLKNKTERKQIDDYDFELSRKLLKLFLQTVNI